MQVTADVSKISKSVQRDIAFNLNVLSEAVNVSAQICLVLEIKNIVSFICVFIENEAAQQSMTMWKHCSVMARIM